MTIKLPSFEPGTEGTLLDSVNAKQLKAFAEAFNSVQIIKGDKNEMKISDRNVVISINVEQLGAESGGIPGGEGDAIDVVGSDGKLNKVAKRSDWATPSAYPTVLRCGTAGSAPASEMAASYVSVYGATPASTSSLIPTAFQATSAGGYIVNLVASSSDGLYMQNAAVANLFLQMSAITRNMSIREIDVCDGGVAKKMLVIGSAPY